MKCSLVTKIHSFVLINTKTHPPPPRSREIPIFYKKWPKEQHNLNTLNGIVV